MSGAAGFVLVECVHRYALKRHRMEAVEKEAVLTAPTTTVKAIRFKAFTAPEPKESERSDDEVLHSRSPHVCYHSTARVE